MKGANVIPFHARTASACMAANVSRVMPLTRRDLARPTKPSQRSDGIDSRLRQLLTVEALSASPVATAPVPPKLSMTLPTERIIGRLIVRNLRTGQEFTSCEKPPVPNYAEIRGMADTVKVIGNRLVKTREALGFQQSEFCKEIRVAKNTYNPFEKGHRQITLIVATKIKERFGISLDWIYCGDPATLPAGLFRKIDKAA